MLTHKASGETQALINLLTIDDEIELHRYRHTNLTEPQHADCKENHYVKERGRRQGKENQVVRRQVLPKLNSSKEELKLILRRLEGEDLSRKSEALCERALQPLRSYDNDKPPPLKSFRECKDALPVKYTRKARTN